MELASIWKEKQSKIDELKKRVELGEFECAHNPTVSRRNPYYNAGDPKRGCKKVATHVETIRRQFVMGTFIYDVPLCDEHSGWHF